VFLGALRKWTIFNARRLRTVLIRLISARLRISESEACSQLRGETAKQLPNVACRMLVWTRERHFMKLEMHREGSGVRPILFHKGTGASPHLSLMGSQCSKTTQAEFARRHNRQPPPRVGYTTCRPLDLGQPGVKEPTTTLAEVD
jgi:hypothetical protein